MRICLDAMSGDKAPGEIVKGALLAAQEHDCEIILVGDQQRIQPMLEGAKPAKGRITVVHCEKVITMKDDPLSIVRSNKDSSMGICLQMLADGGADAMVSAGNTGALLTGATLRVKCIQGIKRAALGVIMPFEHISLMLDAGANVVCQPDFLVQFAKMGAIYMKGLFGVKNPSVGLINNGEEDSKGTPLQVETYKLLREDASINFIGNVETREMTTGNTDVLVTDGFTGNIILKLIEGFGDYLNITLKRMFTASILTKVAALFMRGQLRELKRSLDSTEYGGVPLLGIRRAVIKAHGSSNAKAVKNAIRQAVVFVDSGVIEEIAAFASSGIETGEGAQNK